jgi:hypothetical protein
LTSDGPGDPFPISRRHVLLGAGALAGSAAIGLAGAGAAHAGGAPTAWPRRGLGPRDAGTVDASQFLPVAQLTAWHQQLDSMGMRATGAPVHEQYVDQLVSRLKQVGVKHVHTEKVPIDRWSATRWSLEVTGPSGAGPIGTASYIPYSGGTPPGGVEGPLALVPVGQTPAPGSLAGKVAVLRVPATSTPHSTMELIAYGTYDPQHLFDPAGQYSRPWTGITGLISLLDALPASGAVGAVAVIDLPAAGAHGSYYPYDGVIRTTPGVFVDEPTGRHLEGLATSDASVRLTLDSATERTVSRNVVGVIEGRSPQTVILNSHTDGPNAVEDNGPNTIVAMCQYLARLPKASLPRTLVVSLTTGHFHGGIGQTTFVAEHRDSTLRQAVCGVTLEHLGALEWDNQPDGTMALTGRHELGVMFVPENRALVDASLAALRRAGAGPALVLRPYVPAPGSPNGYGWPGEGTQLWTDGHLPTVNYITGPTYLLNWGIPTTNKCDFVRMRRQAVSFTQMTLDLCRVPSQSLATLDLPGL